MYRYFALAIFTYVLLTTACAGRPDNAFSWYSTIGEMKNLTVLDNGILDILLKRVKRGSEKLLKIKSQINLMKKNVKATFSKSAESFASPSHDVLSNRYAEDWIKLSNLSRFAMSSEYKEKFSYYRDRLPNNQDLESVLEALLDLQTTYKLNASDLAEGYVLGKFCGKRISTPSCEILAQASCEKSTTFCRQWVDVLLARIDHGEQGIYNKDDTNRLLMHRLSKAKFAKICASSVIEFPDKVSSNYLQCHMWTNFDHPWLVLQPVAMEMLSNSPPVARFFNVISDEDIAFLKSLAIPKLGAAQTMMAETNFTVNSYRVAHNCWLTKRNNTVLQRLDRYVHAITGLQIARSSEQLQIANYGIAGHYIAHTDQTPHEEKKELKKRNRKATFMFYLSDVESGGATAFLHPNLAVKPIKGSAVFWHNLLPSGMSDDRTMHGSCPVLFGDKWVANKWILETKQEVCKLSEYIGRMH